MAATYSSSASQRCDGPKFYPQVDSLSAGSYSAKCTYELRHVLYLSVSGIPSPPPKQVGSKLIPISCAKTFVSLHSLYTLRYSVMVRLGIRDFWCFRFLSLGRRREGATREIDERDTKRRSVKKEAGAKITPPSFAPRKQQGEREASCVPKGTSICPVGRDVSYVSKIALLMLV